MKHVKCCAAVILILASGTVAARQKMSQPEAVQRLADDASRQAGARRADMFGDRWNDHMHQGMVSLPAARKSLAEEWQKLGLSPEQAKAVASTYRSDNSAMLLHPPLDGRSDKEVSEMIHAALTKKNYRMANQLLIDYERQRLHLEVASAAAPTR
jgi:hypothetical protein